MPPRRLPYRQLLSVVLLSLLMLVVLPTSGFAQGTDPCLESLSGQPAELERYDALVGEYLEAAGQPKVQVQILDELWEVCGENLRLVVFRATALTEDGQCEAAAREFQWVLDQASEWPHATNATDAATRAEEGLEGIRTTCVAQVQVNCADGAFVQVGERKPQPCPAAFELPVGGHDVVVSAEGFETLRREYTFRVGNNFIEVEALNPLAVSGRVEFVCGTPGTEILIGPERFDCPASRVMPTGTVAYIAIRPGLEVFEGQVTVEDGGVVTAEIPGAPVEAVVEEKTPQAFIRVECDPPGTDIVITGDGLGEPLHAKCPNELAVPGGAYQIEASAPDLGTDVKQVRAAPGERLRLEFALSAPSSTHIAIQAMGGGGFLLTNQNDEEFIYSTDGTEAASLVGFVKLALGLIYHVDPQNGVVVGLGGRYGFGFDVAISGQAFLDYIFSLESLHAWIGVSGGYGKMGAVACGSTFDQIEGEPLDCDEVEEASFIFGIRFGIKIDILDSFAILLPIELTFVHDPPVFDFGGGIEYRF